MVHAGNASALDVYIKALEDNGEVHCLTKIEQDTVFAIRGCHFLHKTGEGGNSYGQLKYKQLDQVACASLICSISHSLHRLQMQSAVWVVMIQTNVAHQHITTSS